MALPALHADHHLDHPLHETAEAVVRGHKSGLLSVGDYNNLTQCEALDDIKLNLVRRQGAGVIFVWIAS